MNDLGHEASDVTLAAGGQSPSVDAPKWSAGFTVDADNRLEIERAMIEECVELFESDGWTPRSRTGGVHIETKEVPFRRHDRGTSDERRGVVVLRGRVDVGAPRARLFDYLADLTRTHEWDPTDDGHEVVERYDASALVIRTTSKLPFPFKAREGLFFVVRRADCPRGRSLVCYKSVAHRARPVGAVPRLLQHTFCWVIEERAGGTSTVTVVVSVAEGLLPRRLMEITLVPGWRSILAKIRSLSEQRSRTTERPGVLARLAAAASSTREGVETAVRLLDAPHPLLDERHRRSPGGFTLRVVDDQWTILTGPDAVRFFYGLGDADVDPFALRLRMPTLHLPGIEPPRDLFESTQLTRTMLLERFSRNDAGALVDTLRRTAEDALDARLPAEHGHVDDFFRVLLETCALMAARALLGETVYRALPGDFARTYGDIEDSLTLACLIAPWVPSPRARAADEAKRRLVRALWPLVTERRGVLRATPPPDDVLQAYVDARRPDGTPIPFSDANILWLLNAMLWAAHHYPAVHAFWAGVELLSRPDLRGRVLDEQRRFTAVDAAAVGEMSLLRGCLLESMRLHPVTLLPRLVRRDLRHGERSIPAGSILALCPYLEHQNPAVFPEPRAFDPDRWIGERGRQIPGTSFLPGGGGRWGCIGLRLTSTLLTTLWATLLRRFDLTLASVPAQKGQLLLMPPSSPARVEYRRKASAPRPHRGAARPHDIVYRSQRRELDLRVTDVEGRIPDDLQGTFLRNGPALFEHGDDRVNNVDGHGMIGALGLRGGEAVFRSRFVRTDVFEEEMAAGRQVRRRLFTNRPGRWSNLLDVRVANPANHDVYFWGGRVLAANDSGHHALEPVSLTTLGADRWNGAVPAGHLMCPMPRHDPHLDRLVGFSLSLGLTSPSEVTFHELDREWVERRRVTHRLGRPAAALHDLAFTERWYVVIEHPTRLHLPTLLRGRERVADAVRWQLSATPLLTLVPRDPSAAGAAVAIPLPRGVLTAFHVVNAFERGDEITVDAVVSSGPPEVSSVCSPALRERHGTPLSPPFPYGLARYVVRPADGTIEATAIGGVRGDFASIHRAHHGRPHRHVYLLLLPDEGSEPVPNAVQWAHEIARVDAETGARRVWNAGPRTFCSQPVFAPRRGSSAEDDGYVLSYAIDADRQQTDVLILDARSIESGPVARLHLGDHLPPAIHCRFEPELDVLR